MLTLVTDERRKMFGVLVGDNERNARINYTPLGNALEATIWQLEQRFREIEIVDFIIMPDHLHLLIQVKEQLPRHLGYVLNWLKRHTTIEYQKMENERTLCFNLTMQRDSRDQQRQQLRIEAIRRWIESDGRVMPADGDLLTEPLLEELRLLRDRRKANGLSSLPVCLIPPLWQTGYNDRIVRHNGQIATLKRYLSRNPGRLWAKLNAEKGMMRVQEVQVALSIEKAQELKQLAEWLDERRSLEVSKEAFHDETLSSYADLMKQCLRRKDKDGQPYLRFRACGNVEMLETGRPLMQLRLSRSITEGEFERSVEYVLKRCEEEGAIVVSPFLSWSEKEVLRLLCSRGLMHIMIRGEEMSPLWKPSDSPSSNHNQQMPAWYRASPMYRDLNREVTKSDFELTLEGQLLTLAPWPERRTGLKLQKPDMELMNGMARVMGAERVMG